MASQNPTESARQVDREEFVSLLMRTERRLRGFVATLLASVDDVDEVLQNTSLVAWRKLSAFTYVEATPDNEFLRWLCGIARLELLAHRRKRRDACGIVFDDKVLDQLAEVRVESTDVLETRYRALGHCMQRLSASDREMLRKRYCSGVPVRDLADSLGRSSDGVYKSLMRIRNALLHCVESALKREEYC